MASATAADRRKSQLHGCFSSSSSRAARSLSLRGTLSSELELPGSDGGKSMDEGEGQAAGGGPRTRRRTVGEHSGSPRQQQRVVPQVSKAEQHDGQAGGGRVRGGTRGGIGDTVTARASHTSL